MSGWGAEQGSGRGSGQESGRGSGWEPNGELADGDLRTVEDERTTTENLHMKGLPLFDDMSADVEVGVCHFSDVSP